MWAAVAAMPFVVTLPLTVQSRSTVNQASPLAAVTTAGTSFDPLSVTIALLALMVDAQPATRPARRSAASAVRREVGVVFMRGSPRVEQTTSPAPGAG
jgi:hypothetical protein